jgi:hypothetical protein
LSRIIPNATHARRVSIAYVILAHRSPDQLARLVGRLHDPEDRVFVHVDRRVPLEPFARALHPFLADGFAHFAYRRFRSHWADYSLVAATLATLEQAIQDATFSHVSLLSGEDYPLVPAGLLRSFFACAPDHSFVFHSAGDGVLPPDRRGNENWYWNGDLRRVTYWHFRMLDRQLHLPNRYLPWFPRMRPPRGLTLYQGSQWWTLTRAAAHHVVEEFIRRPELRRYFRRTQAPDEFAVQTLLCNSHLMPSLVNDDLHFIEWEGWHARTLTFADLPFLSETSKLFARKLDDAREPGLLDELDRIGETRAARFDESLHALRLAYLPPPDGDRSGLG